MQFDSLWTTEQLCKAMQRDVSWFLRNRKGLHEEQGFPLPLNALGSWRDFRWNPYAYWAWVNAQPGQFSFAAAPIASGSGAEGGGFPQTAPNPSAPAAPSSSHPGARRADGASLKRGLAAIKS